MVPPARAQSPYSFLPRRLTTGDMDILRTEAAKLGPNGPKDERWHNPKSGHSGIVTFLSADTEKGLACRRFRYTFHTGTAQDGSPYTLNWCQTSGGDWAIAN
jgi:surface antigen